MDTRRIPVSKEKRRDRGGRQAGCPRAPEDADAAIADLDDSDAEEIGPGLHPILVEAADGGISGLEDDAEE